MSEDAPDVVSLNVRESALSDDDKRAFEAAQKRAAVGEYRLEHKTIGEIVAEQHAFEAGD